MQQSQINVNIIGQIPEMNTEMNRKLKKAGFRAGVGVFALQTFGAAIGIFVVFIVALYGDLIGSVL